MILNHTKPIGIVLIVLLITMFSVPTSLFSQQEVTEYNYYNPKQKKYKDTSKIKEPQYKSIPPTTFMTFHAGVQGTYTSPHFFNYQVPVFGFKIGTMRNTGWFLGMMTNFNFKGAFNTFQTKPEKIEKEKRTYIEGFVGLTGRYFKPVSFHFGVGYFYNTLNQKTEQDSWGHTAENVKHGPVLTAGFMFHIHNVALSLEVSSNYNIANLGKNYRFQAERVGLGAKIGIGFCIPRKKKQKKEEYNLNRDFQDNFIKDLRKPVPLSMTPVQASDATSMLSVVE